MNYNLSQIQKSTRNPPQSTTCPPEIHQIHQKSTRSTRNPPDTPEIHQKFTTIHQKSTGSTGYICSLLINIM